MLHGYASRGQPSQQRRGYTQLPCPSWCWFSCAMSGLGGPWARAPAGGQEINKNRGASTSAWKQKLPFRTVMVQQETPDEWSETAIFNHCFDSDNFLPSTSFHAGHSSDGMTCAPSQTAEMRGELETAVLSKTGQSAERINQSWRNTAGLWPEKLGHSYAFGKSRKPCLRSGAIRSMLECASDHTINTSDASISSSRWPVVALAGACWTLVLWLVEAGGYWAS